MAYKIAVASGKGGTGKTTVSVNLFVLLQKTLQNRVQLIDCDVEEPNDMIFFENALKTCSKDITQHLPVINKDKCTFCRKCSEYCEFNAIVVIPPVKFAEVNSNLCHSCGACTYACKYNAITEHPESIGKVNIFQTQEGGNIIEGRLKIGSAMQTMLIKELKKNSNINNDIIIYDAPPGTSCPVVETVSNVDFIVLVTEPTKFGLHDLKLMTHLVDELEIPYGVVVNKAGLGNDDVFEFLKKNNIELLAKIPFSKEYAGIYSEGKIAEKVSKEIEKHYAPFMNALQEKTLQYEGNHYFKW